MWVKSCNYVLSIEIRPANLTDIDDVIRLNRLTLPENYPPQFFYDVFMQYPKAFIVARSASMLVGYVMTRIEKTLTVIKWINRAHIISVAVHPAYRRQGIARKMMIEACKASYEFYKASEVYLEVRVTNEPAINLYKGLGFEIKEINRGYYSDGEDAYVMHSPLPLKVSD
ncbi:ribosomal-protein-alanine N-acetyltransferase [Candidatus Marsarchaeota G1 archaeon OSP_B]|uniref:Ribosomal-protein-alanine N-acetyltransferase n=2 Tax=Candidatus Marsarchaeota TaxID=1978152 RepID=A0A2R6BZZ3_9ARCH|nr:MAG: ribosomal-protein-alanine N-acetyltransferase [Candidatus Marsarchaeota G1 archaeon OSP_B]PSO04096.1 MAG: ribosomal-protein-alanine N-acetyltransferase [Candidatus Marsarchaeota G2 archaeon ECH_B_SAG-G06]